MKTRTQNFTALDFVYAFGLFVFGGAATFVNIVLFFPILPGISQKLYIIPGIFAWMAILYALAVGLVVETRKNNQSPPLVIVSGENTIQKKSRLEVLRRP